ncbi:cell wall protein [Metarhizium album ARSEF 1941]|uniref:Cell wall protein n=1 Tax=Metarhizium album (strain ARSEF 1941) TaxID=1081103 RepID=A0A0B2WNI6_METAS|nr:cell wall protein [Metarhizium album ARSEF 1941]KHN95533.1 cell wall protein [Metarhizium album ARSEF 1941]
MKLSLASSLVYLAAGAYSSVAAPPRGPSLARRDYDTAISVLTSVKDGFGSVADAARNFEHDAGPLKEATSRLLAEVDSGTAKITGMRTLTTWDCLYLVPLGRGVQNGASSLADNLEAEKDAFEQHNQCATVHSLLRLGVGASTELVDAIAAKVPKYLRTTVETQGSVISQHLERAQEMFAPENCVDSQLVR